MYKEPQFLQVPFGQIKPWGKNPRGIKKKDIDLLAKSIHEKGQFQVLTCWQTGDGQYETGGGNMRWHAMREVLHYPDDKPIWISLNFPESEKEKIELSLLDNMRFGYYEEDKLAELVYPHIEEIKLEDFKVDVGEPINLKDIVERFGPDIDDGADDVPEIDDTPAVTKTGDLFTLGRHRILCGDSTKAEDVARLMAGKKVDMVLTSPPYAVGKEYERGKTFNEHLILLREFANRAIENTIPGGFIFINFGEIASQSHAGLLTGSKRQCIYLISKDYWQIFHKERGCDLYAQRIWYKPFNRLQQPFWSYHTSIPHYQEWEHIWTWRTPGGNKDQVHDWDISVHAIWDTRNETTDDKPLTRHVAAFPVGIPERALRAHSARGAFVLDLFLGSGTTLIAAEKTGRTCYGMEIDPKYCDIIIKRYADYVGISEEIIRQTKENPEG